MVVRPVRRPDERRNGAAGIAGPSLRSDSEISLNQRIKSYARRTTAGKPSPSAIATTRFGRSLRPKHPQHPVPLLEGICLDQPAAAARLRSGQLESRPAEHRQSGALILFVSGCLPTPAGLSPEHLPDRQVSLDRVEELLSRTPRVVPRISRCRLPCRARCIESRGLTVRYGRAQRAGAQ